MGKNELISFSYTKNGPKHDLPGQWEARGKNGRLSAAEGSRRKTLAAGWRSSLSMKLKNDD